jgi:hypothetical protein
VAAPAPSVTEGLQLLRMTSTTWIRRLLVVAVLGAATVGAVPPSLSSSPAASASEGLGAGGEYHALNPARIHDTRAAVNDPVAPGKKSTSPTGTEYDVQITGMGGVPENASEVLAVVLNVTVAAPEAQGNLAVRASGAAPATSSLVNFLPGRNVPNLAVVGVGTNGRITVKLSTPVASRADVVIDVFGWISTTSHANRGARLVPAGPGRIADTRSGSPLRAGQSIAVKVRGAASTQPTINPIVPNDPSVTAVMVNVTAINREPGSTSTNIALTPVPLASGEPAPTSNTNVIRGLVKASMAIVPIGPDGNIHVRNHLGDIHVAIDVLGYFRVQADTTTTGRIIPLAAPFRAFDTRLAAFGKVPLGTGYQEDWSFQKFAASVTLPSAGGAKLDQQSALIGNLTGTQLTRVYPTVPITTFLAAYPGGQTRPNTSNVNVPEGENVPNMSLLRYGTKGTDQYVVQAYNHIGSLHYLLDVYAIVLK